MRFNRKSGARGFTLVELMIIVVVLGILVAVASTSFMSYVKRSKSAEASGNLAKIYHSQIAYLPYAQERGVSTFVNAPAVPTAAPGAAKYTPDVTRWTSSTEWSAIGFSLDGAHYYQYACPGDGAGFTARAIGNLDGDSTRSTFERPGVVVASGEVQSGGLTVTNEFE